MAIILDGDSNLSLIANGVLSGITTLKSTTTDIASGASAEVLYISVAVFR